MKTYTIFLYLILIALYLGLSKVLTPKEFGMLYIPNQKNLNSLSSGNPVSAVLIDMHATGFIIKTYYQKYRLIVGLNDVEEIIVRTSQDFAIKNKLDLPSMTRKKKGQEISEPFIKFRTSAICVHPKTKQLFLLSASDYLLFIFDANGTIKHLEQLNPNIFNKAEGISFFDNGDMLITNEGQDNRPTVLRFKYEMKR